jgi:hypothetical protein
MWPEPRERQQHAVDLVRLGRPGNRVAKNRRQRRLVAPRKLVIVVM